jgi:2-C-methyl-D-erythritol 2,4-cyclodiphosphate synthase
MDIRIGQGYDVHQLVEHRQLIVGGVEIDYERGLLGHSDADVLLHSITDAIIGALGLGDIGHAFPDTDPSLKGISSIEILASTSEKMKKQGYSISNIDSTIIAEAPKMKPHLEKMKENISKVLNLSVDRINIKATTTEKLGSLGRGEGMASQAVVLLIKE